MSARMLDAIERLLRRERQVLLAGQLDALPELVVEKARLVTRLAEAGPHDRDRMAALVGLAVRNQDLLAQAIAGVRAAARRLEALRAATADAETYDRSGHRHPLAPGAGRIERRA